MNTALRTSPISVFHFYPSFSLLPLLESFDLHTSSPPSKHTLPSWSFRLLNPRGDMEGEDPLHSSPNGSLLVGFCIDSDFNGLPAYDI